MHELPRYAEESEWTRFRLRRRHGYYAVAFIFVCWMLYPSRLAKAEGDDALRVNWSSYAYSVYATDTASLCHAVMILDALARFGSKADRVLFYPDHWDTKVASSKDRDSQLLILARDSYKAKLYPVKPLQVAGRTEGDWVWDETVTKFMAFSLEYYDRVIALESDLTLLDSLDELFLLPATQIAMPRAYGTDSKPWPLSSMLMVIKPSLSELEIFKRRMEGGGDSALVQMHRFDMEILNERYEESALVLPHRPYALRTAEFRRHDHVDYLGDPSEIWDAEKVYKEAKLVQFSDRPLPPPWFMWPQKGVEETQPDCGGSHEGTCAERRIWKGLYDDFRRRRRDVCKLLSAPAPDWDQIKAKQQASKTTEAAVAASFATATPSGSLASN
ncbi:glucose N-acetyltransferase 1 [Pyrenophora seminiperda CCB06]|uniref:Glucose N-acetyltransferase 1 n=1 Tax=Pyrenophora seminiperda CCB06 TaxID=1302712 RepID=A0A3M7M716_9PLEO|nr:glucose N-acetyltransferase 1 [Pyrenophora seminiperda CCB06]